MRAAVVVITCVAAGCGHARPEPARIRARVVPVQAGAYYASKHYRAGGDDILDTVEVTVALREDGGAAVTLYDHFAALGEPARDDDTTIEMIGRWVRADDRVDVGVVTTSACVRSVFDSTCVKPDWAPTAWNLRCRAMQPVPPSELPSPALVCEFADGAPVPRYTVVLDGVRVLVVGGPDGAIRFTYD